MNKGYETPDIKVIMFGTQDVLTSSGESQDDPFDPGYDPFKPGNQFGN